MDQSIIKRRKSKFRLDSKLIPPRAMTSEGEIITLRTAVRTPIGVLVGSPVSEGTVKGHARVVLNWKKPSWIKGTFIQE